MRDPNYKSIGLNKAAVSISASVYDRRALDTTADRPLLNSLNHLTFLTSTSAKVRETLSTDGGLERLVCILRECYLSAPRGKQSRSTTNSKREALVAWKWTLAFQCLVLVCTRGTEKIRTRLVDAGLVPVLATVLDNHLLVSRNFDVQTDTNLNGHFHALAGLQENVLGHDNSQHHHHHHHQQQQQHQQRQHQQHTHGLGSSHVFNLMDEEDFDVDQNISDEDEKVIASHLAVPSLAQMFPLHGDAHSSMPDIEVTSPRMLIGGMIVPSKDDIVWALQLLAFISKYSNMKEFLQLTHFVDDLSLRKLLRCSENNNCSLPPPLENDDDNDEMELVSNFSSDESEQTQQTQSTSTSVSQQRQPQQSRQITHQYQHQYQHSRQHQYQHLSQAPPFADSQVTSSQPDSQSSQPLPQTQSDQIFSPQSIHIQSDNSSDDITRHPTNNHQQLKNQELTQNYININQHSNNRVLKNSSSPNTKLTNLESKKHSCLTNSLLKALAKFENCCLLWSQHESSVSPSSTASSSSSLSTSAYASTTDVQDQVINEEKTLNFLELSVKLNNFYSRKHTACKLAKIRATKEFKNLYNKKWCYETYFNNPNLTKDTDYDPSCVITQRINIFPLVEKFTVKSLNTGDSCYWSGVIMRNSCRKDESRGGVRQCACFDCGKWESSPREFAKCRRCKRTKYCSKECQLKGWVYHKHWCVDSNASAAANQANGQTGSASANTNPLNANNDMATTANATPDPTINLPNPE